MFLMPVIVHRPGPKLVFPLKHTTRASFRKGVNFWGEGGVGKGGEGPLNEALRDHQGRVVACAKFGSLHKFGE